MVISLFSGMATFPRLRPCGGLVFAGGAEVNQVMARTLSVGRNRRYVSHMVEKNAQTADDARQSRPDGAALLHKACDVLEAVAAIPGGTTYPALAERLGMSRTTLYRILNVLVQRGLLRQDPSRRTYAIGFRLMEMAQGISAGGRSDTPDLAALAAPELRALRDATGETAYVAVQEGQEVVALGKFEGAHEVRSAARLGQRKPLHCTSQGKAILAFLPEGERNALLRRLALTALTPHTITDRRRFLSTLQIIGARGFATDDEEIAEGVRCVGAPVLDPQGRVAGAISIAGPAWRMTRERLELLGPEVAAAARRIGAQLRPPTSPVADGGTVAVVAGPQAFRGALPRWCGASSRLWWSDCLAPELRCLPEQGEDRGLVRTDAPIRALLPCRGGEVLIIDVGGRVTRVGADGQASSRLVLPQAVLALRTHPGGVPWAAVSEPGGGSLIGPLNLDGFAQPVWRLPGIVSALAWSTDGRALFAATPEHGTVHQMMLGREVPLLLTRLPPGGGHPTGLAVDAEGLVWVALYDGWSIARLRPEGDVDRLLPLPVPRPTDLTFGGPRLDTLYVTTARDGMSLDALASAPISGRLLMVQAGVAGVAEPESNWASERTD
jgi:DNA-binding IclR family transcriptional regulator/sugar lactone lactonase YvrE